MTDHRFTEKKPIGRDADARASQRLIQPNALRTDENVAFSGGRGTDVWNMMIHAMAGETLMLRKLLQKDAGLANCSWGYFTPLHFAVRSGNMEAVRLLLEYGADSTERTLGWQDDMLTKARDRGYEDIADLLDRHLAERFQSSPAGRKVADWIKEGRHDELLRELDGFPELVHAGDERGNTPLHWAVLTRQIGLIDELLRRGADIEAKRADGATPTLLAIEGDYWFRANRDLNKQALRNEWFLVGYMIARGAEYDICAAAAVGDSAHIAALLKMNPSMVHAKNAVDKRPLGYAAKRGYTDTLKLLLEQGADPNAEERGAPRGSALWNAVAGNHGECVKLLLEHGADPNAMLESSSNPLGIAMHKGYDSLVKLLYAHGATLQLDSACWLGKIDLAGEIIGANPSLVNAGGDYGPLCMAAGNGHTEIVRMLLRAGADLNAAWYANNYMGYAADAGLDMVRLLLESGADPNNCNWQGVTYLHKAAWLGHSEWAELLLEFGSDLNAIDEEYNATPLGWAAKYGKTELVRLLLDKGADAGLPADEPWSQPLAWAERKGHEEIAALLRSRR
ncbi:ankyrin repeat domain-containing protein [Paenibacillus allorhizosphaerae]|uniref:Ankyrin repeat domain-containing protein n=1 Tax=Paenibacillus allorhizosphaerae TaxID=2849866 RepID=A0ABM8VMD0_9BACL|nr:ankyrin repeat domain-containing protein [Paenibacillus allorhizosphaerae]CAG7649852.1 hypothetical protein PAECIP111802_04573 [Paenibacillus allorhizosphaerae]